MNRLSWHRGIGLKASIVAATGALCVLIVAAGSGCSPAQRYRQLQEAQSLFAALHQQVKNGDSVQNLQKLLGPGTQPANKNGLLRATRRFAQRYPQDYPAGVKDEDLFIVYSTEGDLTVALQFRDGRLINFNRQDYEQVPRLMKFARGRPSEQD